MNIDKLKNCIIRYAHDRFETFPDGSVKVDEDGLGFRAVIYELDDELNVNRNKLEQISNLRVTDNGVVLQQTDDTRFHLHSTVAFESWNDFISYDEYNAGILEVFYMNWDDYKI